MATTYQLSKNVLNFDRVRADSILAQLPPQARKWVESLPWEERRYVLSLSHLICAAPAEQQAEFLDEYTADGLVSRLLQDRDTREKVKIYLRKFRINNDLTETLIRDYIRQFYIHSAQDVRRQPDLYLEAALKLVMSTEEQNHVFNYILGFEVLKMIFKMSWAEHERLYRLQKNQEEFITTYIRPIQHAHELNGIVRPKKYEKSFFAKRDYFIQKPDMSEKKLVELVMATFTTGIVSNLGFSIIRHLRFLEFDFDYIFNGSEPEGLFAI